MDSERRRYAQGTGRNAPRLQAIPGALVIPAKAGTYWRAPAYAKRAPTPSLRAPTAVPSPAAFAASSPLIGRGDIGACAPGRGASRPVSKSSPGPRHSRESGNLPYGGARPSLYILIAPALAAKAASPRRGAL